MSKNIRRLLRIPIIMAILCLMLLLGVLVALQLPVVQNRLSDYAIEALNEEFGTKISVDSVSIDWFGDVMLHDVEANDHRDSLFIEVKKIRVSTDLFALIRNQEQIVLDKIVLYQPKVRVITYAGEATDNFILFTEQFDDGQPSNPDSKFRLQGAIEARDGELSIVNLNLKEVEQVWLDAKNVTLKVSGFNYFRKEIQAKMDELSFNASKNNEEYEVKNMSLSFAYDSSTMKFEGIRLLTDDSDIRGDLFFNYENIKDFGDFNNKIIWDLTLAENNRLGYKDLRYFMPDWSGNESFELIGKVNGSMNDWDINQLSLKTTGLYAAASELELENILDTNQFRISSANFRLNTTIARLTEILPKSIRPEFLKTIAALGAFNYKGQLNVNPLVINAKGEANSDLGGAKIDVRLVDYSEESIWYEGKVSTSGLNVRPLAKLDFPLNFAGNVEFNGQGADIETLDIQTNSRFDVLNVSEYRLRNVAVDGRWANQMFDGRINSQDPKYPIDANGNADFSQSFYTFNLEASLNGLPLSSLGVKDDHETRIFGQSKTNVQFSNLNDFQGEIFFPVLELVGNNYNQTLNSVSIESTLSNNYNQFLINAPNFLTFKFLGDFKLGQLPQSFENALSHFLPEIEYAAQENPADFTFYGFIEQNPLAYLYPSIQVAPNTLISGKYNEGDNSLDAELKSGRLEAFENIWHGLTFQMEAKPFQPSMLHMVSDSVSISGVLLRNLDAKGYAENQVLDLNTKFQIGKKSLINFDLNFLHTTDEAKNWNFVFSPSTMNLNNQEWEITHSNTNEGFSVVYNPQSQNLILDNIEFVSGEQTLDLRGMYTTNSNYDFAIDLNKILLEKAIPKDLLPDDLSILGEVNGNVRILQNEEGFSPTAEITLDGFTVNDYLYGNFNTTAAYDETLGLYNLEGTLEKDNYQTLVYSGSIDNSGETPKLDVVASIDKFEMQFLEGFLAEVTEDITGTATGYFKAKGEISDPEVSGYMDLENFGFHTPYTGVRYNFPGKPRIPVNKFPNSQGIIQLDGIAVEDGRYKTTGKVDGALLFKDLGTWFLNVALNTQRLLFLDTRISDNELFFGKVFGKGSVEIYGPTDDINFNINAASLNGSEFTINTGSSFVDVDNSLVRFVSEDQEKSNTPSRVETPLGLTINMKIDADPGTRVNLIFDEANDHGATALGNTKNLSVTIDKTGAINMNGSYTLTGGTYQLRQGLALNKNFNIQPGSRISWSGDPYDADMKITATFDRTVSNIGDYLGIGFSQTYLVRLIVSIQETLSAPEIGFDIAVPEAGTDINTQLKAQFNNNPDEKLSQFGALLFLGKFLNPNERENIAGGAATAVAAEVALRQLSNILTSIAREFQIDFEFVQGNDLSASSDVLKTRLGVSLNPRLTLRGAFGLPLENNDPSVQTVFTGEGSIEYDISKKNNGGMVLRVFTEPTTFGVENFSSSFALNQSYGGGIVFRKSFDSFGELFGSKTKDKTDLSTQDSTLIMETADTLTQKEKTYQRAEKRNSGLVKFR